MGIRGHPEFPHHMNRQQSLDRKFGMSPLFSFEKWGNDQNKDNAVKSAAMNLLQKTSDRAKLRHVEKRGHKVGETRPFFNKPKQAGVIQR